MEIRYMTPNDDKSAISRIYEESWKYAYRGIIPQHYLDSIPEGQWVSALNNHIWDTLVCIDNGKFVGTSSFCKSRFQQFDGWGEIVSIYLLPDYMGKGYGKILLRYVLSELKKLGYEDVFLWVLEENIKARSFYEKLGFLQSDDILSEHIGGKNLYQIRYIYDNR